jgi:hypothetical protein
LNLELTHPFTKNIAHSWSKVFESDLFGPFSTILRSSVAKLLKEVEDSAADGLKDRVKTQAEQCLEEAGIALNQTIQVVQETMNNEQKEISRCLVSHVREQLIGGYDLAMNERGRGSVARQKAVFHDYVKKNKQDLFENGAEVILGRLDQAAVAVGLALTDSLHQLSQKVGFLCILEI